MKQYRWLENGEMMQRGDEYAYHKTLDSWPTDPNSTDALWRAIPGRSIGQIYYDCEYTGTRRKYNQTVG